MVTKWEIWNSNSGLTDFKSLKQAVISDLGIKSKEKSFLAWMLRNGVMEE